MFLEGIEVEHWLEISGSNEPQKLGFPLNYFKLLSSSLSSLIRLTKNNLQTHMRLEVLVG